MYNRTTVHIIFFLLMLAGPIGSTVAQDDLQWPFYSPQDAALPELHSAWIKNGVDAFVLRRLEQNGLSPASEATRRHMIRRLYYDLIGLPPAPSEVDAFLSNKSDAAYDELVNRLLDDPRYGERWARLWLDLARYADTAGYEGDPDLPHAWRFRDYVINSLNSDKPYDTFIKEQIAGDEFDEVMGASDLPTTPSERVVALTFLRLAPFTEPRGDESRHELLSEMTSTVGSVFLGLTVGCAKCHDHKHDGIPTKDFYRLQAFFSTISIPRPEPGDGFQIGGSLAAPFYRKGEQEWADAQRQRCAREIEESKRDLGKLRTELTKLIGGHAGLGLQAMGGPLGNNYIFGRTSVHQGTQRVSVINCNGKQWTFFTDNNQELDTGSNAGTNQGQWFGDIPTPKHITLGQYSEGTGRIKVANANHVGEFSDILIYDHPLSDSERKSIEMWISSVARTPEGSHGPPSRGLRFWLDASDLDANPASSNLRPGSPIQNWKDRIGGITISQVDPKLQPVLVQFDQGTKNDRAGAGFGVRFENDFMSGPLNNPAFRNDQTGSMVLVYTARHSHEGYGFEVGGDGVFLSTFINPTASSRESIDSILNDPNNKLVSEEKRKRHRWLSTREKFLNQEIKRLQPVAMSLRHSYGPPYEPGVPTTRVMIRGEYDNPGEEVSPGFLSCITGNQNPAEIRLDPFKRWPTRSRRMALAQWIASKDNPLTARVIVNRLWHWHFGRGIVSTPSDFGKLSGGPSHPQLLDWLAVQLTNEKWSLKAIHRLIVTSATYRQTSLHRDQRAEEIDPDNKLLWRFRRRRLEAEAVRDSVLAVSGRLNPDRYGLPIFPPLPDDIEERVKYSSSKWDTQHGPEGRKRSIYIYQQRTLTMPFMQSFDSLVCDESRPRRQQSVTPLQALAMYNGSFVSNEANHFASRVRTSTQNDLTNQITHAFLLALSRPPTQKELAEMRGLAGVNPMGLTSVCRVLLNCNEFIYVD